VLLEVKTLLPFELHFETFPASAPRVASPFYNPTWITPPTHGNPVNHSLNHLNKSQKSSLRAGLKNREGDIHIARTDRKIDDRWRDKPLRTSRADKIRWLAWLHN
jgi:hypothetical protein